MRNIKERRVDRRHRTSRRNHPLLSWYPLFFALLLLTPVPAHAQEPGPTARRWRTFTADNSSLAPGVVWTLLEDTQGRMWVGTGGGVSVYAAGAWQTFTAENSPLAPGSVNVLLEDTQGRMWVGTGYHDELTDTKGGVSVYVAGAWQTFTAENSPLAPGDVNALLEDSQGHVWVGTGYYVGATSTSKGGVSVYAAGAWQTFTAEDSPLAWGRVTALLEDAQGRMWVGTDGGVSVYAAGDWQTFTAEDFPLAPGWVYALLEDSQGRMWVGTSGGVRVYAAGAWQTFTAEDSALAPGGVEGLLEDSQGHIWAGMRDGVSVYAAGDWQTFTAGNSPLALGWVYALLEDTQGRIWAGTGYYDLATGTSKGGMSVYAAGVWQTFSAEDFPVALGEVRALLEDSQGRIWVGMWGGLSVYVAEVWQTFTAEDFPLAPGVVWTLLDDSQGRMWVGTRNGVSVYVAGAWQTFTAEDSPLAPGDVNALLEDSQGRMWVGTGGGVSVYAAGAWQTFTHEDSRLAPGEVTALLEDSQGHMWVGTTGGVSVYAEEAWQTFTAEDSPLAPGGVQALLEDSQGRIWVGTGYYDGATGNYRGGVSVYAPTGWQTFTAEDSPLAPGWVYALLEDSQGRVWVGTGDGLSVYAEGVWQTFTSDNSPLAPGVVSALLEDTQGRIWVGADGVSLYQAGTWQTFTAEDSTLAPRWIWALLEDAQGRIWVGTRGGISVHRHGDRPYAFLRYAGPASGQTTGLQTTSALTFTFPSPRSALEIGFSGVDIESDPDRLLFRCRLVGYDAEEVPCVSPVYYRTLPPGTYTFRVRALDEDLRSSEPATATITLISTAPPTPTPIPAPTPTPQVVIEPGLPKEAIIPLTGGLGGLAIAIVLGIIIRSKIRRARRLAAWRRGADPYVVGDVIEEPERFYGREEALTELLHALEAGNHVALYGARRIGKTSLLHQLAYRLRNLPQSSVHFLPVFANLQMVSEPRFFSALAEAIAKAARRELEQRGQSLPALRVDSADEYIRQRERYDSLDLADDLEVIVEALQKAIGRSPRIVLLLDEADKMNGYDPHTQEALRGLLMTPVGNHVKLVWSGQTMNREWHLESSPWYNLFKQELRLGGLDEEAAVRLVQRPVHGVFTYEDEAVRRILELTGREPYPIQRLCSFCVRLLLAEKRWRVNAGDVEAAWHEMEAEDARRAAEGATDVAYQPPRPVWTVAEKGTAYDTGKKDKS